MEDSCPPLRLSAVFPCQMLDIEWPWLDDVRISPRVAGVGCHTSPSTSALPWHAAQVQGEADAGFAVFGAGKSAVQFADQSDDMQAESQMRCAAGVSLCIAHADQ